MAEEQNRLHLVSLGCARNQVDSEVMLGKLLGAGWSLVPDPADASVIVINTCSFIESAIDESIDTILELAWFKESGSCRRLIVAGCLPQRFGQKIVEALPEVDMFLGTGAFDRIVAAVGGTASPDACLLPDPDAISLHKDADRKRFSAEHMAYLKVAEGCSRHCTYCIIPRLRGRQKSRLLKDIVAEAQRLIDEGVKELVLIAQDTTHYGHDLLPPGDLSQLLDHLASLDKRVWIRALYGHPESISEATIDTIAQHGNICSYLDIPIQHASDRILKSMGRNYNAADLSGLFATIRHKIPQVALRTTVITGFPGETGEDFDRLLKFVEATRFDHLGVFTYSDDQDLPSHQLKNHVSPEIAGRRRDRLLSRQSKISARKNTEYIDRVLDVLIEEKSEDNLYIGRTFFQAPEVDGLAFVRTRDAHNLNPGVFAPVRITDALEYDLIGEAL